MWALADRLGVVPAVVVHGTPLARLLTRWGRGRKVHGCRHRGAVSVVLLPDARIWCPPCAGQRLGDPGGCAVCGRTGQGGAQVVIVAQSGHRFIATLCASCDTTRGNTNGQ